MTVEKLKEQLKQFEQDFENVKGQLYRIDGAIQLLKSQISSSENDSEKKEEPCQA